MTVEDARRTLRFDQVTLGLELPRLIVEITTTQIVGAAFATRDFTSVHHDHPGTRALGHPDVYMNILTSTGFVGRFVTDWAGPEALIEDVAITLGRPNYPGDELTLSGVVTVVETAGPAAPAAPAAPEATAVRGRVTVDVLGVNRLGVHIRGTVIVSLPTTVA